MLVNFQDLVSKAVEADHAVACVTIAGYEDAKTVVQAAEYLKKPVMLAVDRCLVKIEGISKVAQVLKQYADKASIPVCLHLNKGFTKEQVIEAIDSGFASVAFDTSTLSLENNILATREIVEAAREAGVSVEGFVSSGDVFAAQALVRDSGVQVLNVSAAPADNIIDIAEAVKIPLASGQSETSARQVSTSGIVKYDLGSVLSETFVEQFEADLLNKDPEVVLRKTVPVMQEFSCKLLRQFYRPVVSVVEPQKPIWGYPARD